MAKLEIDRVLTVGTCCISKATADVLGEHVAEWREHPELPVTFAKGEYGWFIYTYLSDTESVSSDCPPDLASLMALARENDCAWLCIDQDGEDVEGFPVYSW